MKRFCLLFAVLIFLTACAAVSEETSSAPPAASVPLSPEEPSAPFSEPVSAFPSEPPVSSLPVESAEEVSEESVSADLPESSADASFDESEESFAPCEEHLFGDTPVETVGNLDIYECTRCGYRKVVPRGILIGASQEE